MRRVVRDSLESLIGEPIARLAKPAILTVIVVASMACAAGCGGSGNGGEEDCTSTGCEFGVCDESSGECANALVCSAGGTAPAADAGSDAGGQSTTRSTDCLPGFECEGGACKAEKTCSGSGECDRGVCREGGCTNKPSCSEQSDCLRGFECKKGSCVADECAIKKCASGVCRDGACVNPETCSSDGDSCLDGYVCHEGSCVEGEEACNKIECDRGVCSVEEGGCANAESCDGDKQCLQGFYCDSANDTCVENKCDESQIVCDRGVCDPEAAECKNPDTCDAPKECMPTFACVDNKCVAESEKCGEEGCPGNQACSYKPKKLTAECVENSEKGCGSALDCTGERVCVEGSCQSPSSCSNDMHEDNNTKMKATDYFNAVTAGEVNGTVCSGDTDIYAFDSSKDADLRGRFHLTFQYEPIDVGIGDVVVRVKKPDGSTWVEKNAGADGVVKIDKRFGAGSHGVYHIEIDDSGDIHKPGVRYNFNADIISHNVVNACKNAKKLTSSTTGNTRTGASVALDATCAIGGSNSAEDVYEFTVDEKSFVQIEVKPDNASVDMTAALRSKCEVAGTEIACADKGGGSATEKLTARVEKGTYYLIVQSPEGKSSGKYRVTYSRQSASCTPEDNTCKNSQTAKICGPNGQTMTEVSCDFGCNATYGVCKRAEKDHCPNAGDATGGLMERIVWGDLKDDFNPGAGSCLPGNNPDSNGPDAVYKVDLKANHAMTATLKGAGSQSGSLYVLGTCNDASSFCNKGTDSQGTTEELLYRNQSSSKETVYLVADSQSGTTGESTLTVDIAKIICKPGKHTCNGKDIQVCNTAGTARNKKTNCPFGCKNGSCLADRCAEAYDVSAGGTWTFNPNDYSGDYQIGFSSCVRSNLTGPDLVFKADVKAGHYLDATVDDKGSISPNAGIYIVTDCGSSQKHQSTCVDGAEDKRGGTENVGVRNNSSSKKTYFIVVDAEGTGSVSQNWSLTVKNKKPVCTPGSGSCSGPSTVKYCDRRGLGYKTYGCKGSNAQCSTSGGRAVCNNPTGEVCIDAIPVKDGDSKTGNFTGKNSMSLNRGTVGSCQVGLETNGGDTFYRVNLKQNTLLQANLQTTNPYAQLYILGSCFSAQTCKKYTRINGGGTLMYKSSKAETVYVVVDSYIARSSTYTVNFTVTPNAQCVPGTTKCTGSSSVAVCSQTGSNFIQSSCPGTNCSNKRCSVNSTKADSCSTAPSIGKATAAVLDMSKYTNDVNLPRTGCAGDDSPGGDATLEVTANAGQTIYARAETTGPGDNPMIYITSQCSNATSNCVAGSDSAPDSQPEYLQYKVPSGKGGKYYVHFDAEAGYDASEKWNIEVTVQ